VINAGGLLRRIQGLESLDSVMNNDPEQDSGMKANTGSACRLGFRVFRVPGQSD